VDVTGNLGQAIVVGDLLNSRLNATGSITGVTVYGDMTDSSVKADTIGAVTVFGNLSDPNTNDHLTDPDDKVDDDFLLARDGNSSFALTAGGQHQVVPGGAMFDI